MSQSVKVRHYAEIVVLLLQKPTDRILLDTASAPMFVEMLADPYPLEPEFKVRLLKVKPVHMRVGPTESGKIVVAFDQSAEVISLSKEQAAKLGEDVAKNVASLAGSNPS